VWKNIIFLLTSAHPEEEIPEIRNEQIELFTIEQET
jgi:hypothetical protein